jgi:hypothetical protein
MIFLIDVKLTDENVSSKNLHGRRTTKPCVKINNIRYKIKKTLKEQNISPLTM